jgi:anti-sigma factor RsiW
LIPEHDLPTPAELADYANGTLPADRRLVVAEYLATDAGAGARMLAELAQTERLRAAMAGALPPAPAALVASADRLTGAMNRRRQARWQRPVAAAVASFALGWGGHALWQTPGAGAVDVRLAPLAEAAMDARQAAEIARSLDMSGPVAVGALARAAAQLGVSLPTLPPDWTVRGVQVVATPDRPALLVQIDAPGLGEITLFSRAGSDLGPDAPPTAFDYRGAAFAVFERRSSAHVLVDASGHASELGRAAGELLRRTN